MDNSHEDSCTICLQKIVSSLSALDSCSHRFHFDCIETWSKINNTCPLCKERFHRIDYEDDSGRIHALSVNDRDQVADILEEENRYLSAYYCLICSGETDEHLLLLCDGCDQGFHTFCLVPPLRQVPEDDWFCHSCTRARSSQAGNDQVNPTRATFLYDSEEDSDVSDSSDSDFEHDDIKYPVGGQSDNNDPGDSSEGHKSHSSDDESDAFTEDENRPRRRLRRRTQSTGSRKKLRESTPAVHALSAGIQNSVSQPQSRPRTRLQRQHHRRHHRQQQPQSQTHNSQSSRSSQTSRRPRGLTEEQKRLVEQRRQEALRRLQQSRQRGQARTAASVRENRNLSRSQPVQSFRLLPGQGQIHAGDGAGTWRAPVVQFGSFGNFTPPNNHVRNDVFFERTLFHSPRIHAMAQQYSDITPRIELAQQTQTCPHILQPQNGALFTRSAMYSSNQPTTLSQSSNCTNQLSSTSSTNIRDRDKHLSSNTNSSLDTNDARSKLTPTQKERAEKNRLAALELRQKKLRNARL